MFGKMADGRQVYRFTLKNARGRAYASSTLADNPKPFVRDRKGELVDVALGYDTPDKYLTSRAAISAR